MAKPSFMLAAIVIVSGISFYQDNRSRKALEALEALTTPLSKVIRNGEPQSILTTDIVPGDLVIVEEGTTINADGHIVHSNDFSVNESTLTGEAQAVFKSASGEDPNVYQWHLSVIRTSCLCGGKDRTGRPKSVRSANRSQISKKSLLHYSSRLNPLSRRMALIGILVFLIVWAVQYAESKNLLASLLKGLTLAMSILPEEIPVAFTTFMALGS